MSNIANASVEVINKFKSDNDDLRSCISGFQSTFSNVTQRLREECRSKSGEYRELVAGAESLESKARSKYKALQAQANSCAATASSTPKTIKETYTDSNGQQKTREKPNPAYAAAQSAANNARSRAQSAGRLVTTVVEFKGQMVAKYNAVESISRDLERLCGSVQSEISKVIPMVEGVSGNLARALNALTDYKGYKIRS